MDSFRKVGGKPKSEIFNVLLFLGLFYFNYQCQPGIVFIMSISLFILWEKNLLGINFSKIKNVEIATLAFI